MSQQEAHTDELPAAEDDLGFDLRAYVQVVRKRIWIIAALVAVGVTATVLYTMRQPRIYRASASVVIDPQPPQVFGNQVQEVITLGTHTYWANQEYYNTQIDIIENYDLARQTVLRNDLQENEALVPRRDEDSRTRDQLIDTAAGALAGAISAHQTKESRIVTISVRHTNPKLAADLANMHVDTYLEYTRNLRASGSGKVSKFLATELDSAEAKLRESERKLYEFKQNNDILSVSLEDKQNILATDLGRYTSALGDARIQRMELSALRKRAKQLADEEVLESPIFGLLSDSGPAKALKEAYTEEKRRLAELGEELGPRHPGYLSQKKKVDEIYSTLQREARRAVREVDERYEAAVATEKQFAAEVERLKQEAFELGPKTVAYNRLKRQQQSDEENYNLVLGRLRASDLSGRNREINIHRHSQARGAALVSPRMKVNVALAFVLTLLAGIGLAFLLEYLDRTIKTADDVESSVGAPLLGVIPIVEGIDAPNEAQAIRSRDLFVAENPTSRASECCRSIRTNILFSAADRPLKTLTVSSPRPQEGKTTSTIYLGTTMAQSGQKVLLIDTDMRRPRLHRALGTSRTTGLTTLILGESTIDDVVKTTDIPNLYVLPCGPQPPNPAELLLTNRFREVLDQLSERFDRVLLDSPPLLAVTDGVVLARLSSGVLLVAQAGKTTTDDAAECARLLRDVNASILGVILNDMDLSDRRYGYGYYYYRYGYGDEPATAEGPSQNA